MTKKIKIKEVTKEVVNQPKQRKQRRKKAKGGKKSNNTGLQVMDCTLKYVLAKTDPWNPQAIGACVPVDNFAMSQKSHAFIRGTIVMNEYGYGAVWICPCLAQDLPCIYYTLPSSTLQASTLLNMFNFASTSNADAIDLNTSPYTAIDIADTGVAGETPSVKGRIVSAGFRWWYSGAELYRAGWTVPFVSPMHASVEEETIDTIRSRVNVNVIPNMGRQKHNFSIFGIRDAEKAYPSPYPGATSSVDQLIAAYPYSSGVAASTGTSFGAPIAVILFKGHAGTSYEFEYCQHSEFIGAPTVSAGSRNYSDPQGAALADEAVQRVQDNPSKEPTTKNVLKTMVNIARENKDHVVNIGGKILGGDYFGAAMSLVDGL